MSRTALRTAAALGAATALTVAGAGVAAATTADSSVDGNTVSVTFALDNGGLADGDACGAVLTPTSSAATLAGKLANGDLETILGTLTGDPSVTVLKSDTTGLPSVVLGEIAGVGVSSDTASATVEPDVYALVTYCATDEEPSIEAPLVVGNPVDAITGSLAGLTEGDGLAVLSSVLGDGEAGGGLGLDTLSSALGGEAEGELDLAVLSSALGETDAAN